MTALIDIVLPIFAIVASGYVCGWKSLLGPESSEALNGFVYWIALPALLFKAMASVELAQVYNGAFLLAFSGALAVTWALTSLAGWLLFRLNAAEAALHGLNGTYANAGFMAYRSPSRPTVRQRPYRPSWQRSSIVPQGVV